MKELLFSVTKKDLRITYFSGRGAGGQHRNKHQNCVRIFHPKSGAMATGQSSRSRQQNIKEALEGLTRQVKFKLWLNMKIHECLAKRTIEQVVNEQMQPKNLVIEVKDERGRWQEMRNET